MELVLFMLLCLVIGAVVAIIAVKKKWIFLHMSYALGGLVAFLSWTCFLIGSGIIAKTDLYPKYRIVTDGSFYEVETQYSPFTSWWMTRTDFTSVATALAHIESERENHSIREEHEKRDWKVLK